MIMGISSLSANLDNSVIHCAYYRDIQSGESAYPVDLSVSIRHQYANSTNVLNEIVLEDFIILKDYLNTTGLIGVSDVEQTLEFHVLNLRYLNNLYVEVREIRDGLPVLTRVPILIGDTDADPLPDNPVKYPEFSENIPEVVPLANISVHRVDSGAMYMLEATPLTPIQSSKRIYLVEENGEQIFKQVDYNETSDRLFIENSITNLLPNPQFLGSDQPDLWDIEIAGIVLNSNLLIGEIPDTSIWRIRASNSNVFNAFNHITIKTTDKHNIYSGLNALTYSTYYRVSSSSKNIPFNSFNVKVNFYYNDDFISSDESTIAVTSEVDVWVLLDATWSQIPLTANKYSLEFNIIDIDTTELFTLDLYIPQLEASTFATTRTLDSRIQDKFLTGTSFEINLPFFIFVQTHYVAGVGIRGLFSTTTNQANGFEFLASNDTLRFKQYSTTGNVIVNVVSGNFPPLEHNSIVDYGVDVTQTAISFYLNGVMLSTIPCSLSIDQNKNYLVGSLEKSNTTINTELLDFKILRPL